MTYNSVSIDIYNEPTQSIWQAIHKRETAVLQLCRSPHLGQSSHFDYSALHQCDDPLGQIIDCGPHAVKGGEEFLRQAKEHRVQSIEMERVDAEDEDLTMVLKELSFERYQTTYKMRKAI